MRGTIRGVGLVAGLVIGVGCTGSSGEAPAPEPSKSPSEPVTVDAGFPGSAPTDRPRVELGYRVSGADVSTLWANGGLETRAGTLFDKAGLSFHLVPADDAAAQRKRFADGQTPYLRASWATAGQLYEQLCPSQDTPTCPLLVVQLAWSHGDALVARDTVRSVADLKGKTIAVQRGAPYMETFLAVLTEAGLGWQDVQIMWKDNLLAAGGPAEAFRADTNLAAAWVVTPEVAALTGGLTSVGDGQGGTVAGAHVIAGTHDHPRTQAEALFVRQDYAAAHPDEVTRVRAALLHAQAEIEALEARADAGDQGLTGLLGALVATYGLAVLPDTNAAAALLRDSERVGLAGNIAFAGDDAATVDHADLSAQSAALAVAMGRPTWSWTMGVAPGGWDGPEFAGLSLAPAAAPVEASGAPVAVTVPFAEDARAFDPASYAAAFDALLSALQAPGSVLHVRGHADPLRAVAAALEAGVEAGRVVATADRTYTLDGAPLDVRDAAALGQLVAETGDGAGTAAGIAKDARVLSEVRANAVRDAFLAYATTRGVTIDPLRVVAQGAGIDEPVVALPRSAAESARNRRVELTLDGAEAPGAYTW